MKWEKVKLGDIADFSNGINFDKSAYTSGIRIIGVSNFKNYHYPQYNELSEVKREIVRDNDLLLNGDIIFVRSNGNKELVGRCMLIKNPPFPITYSGFCIRARINDIQHYSPDFLTYYFKTDRFRRTLSGSSVGANIQNLSQSRLNNCVIDVPDFYVQQKIVEILSAYDDLIENNQKQIKLLEEAAQRLYKEWFVDLRFPGHEHTPIVDGVPEGWSRKAISELGEYINGFAFKPSDWNTKGKPIIKIKEMGSGISPDTPRNDGERVPDKFLVKSGEILFSWSATLMVMIWDNEDGWLNQHIFKVIPNKGISREFLLQSISKAITEFSNLTTGATMKHIQRNKLDQVYVNVPEQVIMNKYNNCSLHIRERILKLSYQNNLLKEARDRLLPKLMSGEMEV